METRYVCTTHSKALIRQGWWSEAEYHLLMERRYDYILKEGICDCCSVRECADIRVGGYDIGGLIIDT
jgi:hypothetical protein